ncbi:unnamed protein product [Spirodela intermedia]|uniref:Uncharacterized protein n=1 Tax=Spirodela intermedia TaxID=51605 RepID=A0A7I8LHV9_SPIIN|nr:unnamed protein product [Spirodela intermedia]
MCSMCLLNFFSCNLQLFYLDICVRVIDEVHVCQRDLLRIR